MAVAELTLGRLGLAAPFVASPESFADAASGTERRVSLSVSVMAGSLADTKALRQELVALGNSDDVIAVTWTEDSDLDGFYRVLSTSVDTESLTNAGLVSFSITLERLGGEADVIFQSVVVGAVLTNNFTVTAAESAPFLSLPVAAYAYDNGGTIETLLSRTGADGAIPTFIDVSFSTDPRWAVTPANFYTGAAIIKVSTYLRVGETAPNAPTDWELSNGLVRVKPNGANSRLNIEVHNGTTWDTAKVWQFDDGAAGEIPAWDAITIVRNTPEECAIRLTAGIAAGGRHVMDIALRRGSRFARFVWNQQASGTMKVVRNTAEAGADLTPTGASGPVAVVASVDDGDGNRYVVGTRLTHVSDLINGGFSIAAVTSLPFFIGVSVNDATVDANDNPTAQCLQYLGLLAERVVPIRR